MKGTIWYCERALRNSVGSSAPFVLARKKIIKRRQRRGKPEYCILDKDRFDALIVLIHCTGFTLTHVIDNKMIEGVY